MAKEETLHELILYSGTHFDSDLMKVVPSYGLYYEAGQNTVPYFVWDVRGDNVISKGGVLKTTLC